MIRLISSLLRWLGLDMDGQYVTADTLRQMRREGLRQGWTGPDAERCGRWRGASVTEAARTLKWRETR